MASKKSQDIPSLANGWIGTKLLGRGGNGDVYLAERGGVEGAFKLLHRRFGNDVKRRARFVSEIEAMRRCSDIAGVLPLIDAMSVSIEQEVEQPWLVTQVADPLERVLANEPSLNEVVAAMAEVAGAVAEMHARGISHRDIKPNNLFWLENRWVIGDFGLADFEGKEALTAAHERLGPMFYIAPEMLNNAPESDGKAADVYSLVKTLWKLAAGMTFPLPGHQTRNLEVFRLGTYVSNPRAYLLDSMFEAGTDNIPSARPSMREIESLLKDWLMPSLPQESRTTIQLNLKDELDRVAATKARTDAAKAEHAMKWSQRIGSNREWMARVLAFVEEVATTLSESGLSDVEVITRPDEVNCSASVIVRVPRFDGCSAQFYVTLACYSDEFPQCHFYAALVQNFDGGLSRFGSHHITEKMPFFGGSGEAETAFQRATDYIRVSLEPQLKKFLTNATADRQAP